MENMSVLQAFILGVVQGITEFLPISSDGHLVLVQKLLGFHGSMLAFDVMVHFGTLIAIILFFRAVLIETCRQTFLGVQAWAKSRNFAAAAVQYPLLSAARSILISFFVTCIVALLIKKFMPWIFDNLTCVAISWLLTGLALISFEKIKDGKYEMHEIAWQTAILIGLAQAAAVLPGVSRSGSTILIAIVLGVRRKAAMDFSFLMAIPVIFAAVVFELFDHPEFSSGDLPVLLTGMITALVVGYLAIRSMPKLLETGWFFKLGWYLLPMSIFAFFLAITGSH